MVVRWGAMGCGYHQFQFVDLDKETYHILYARQQETLPTPDPEDPDDMSKRPPSNHALTMEVKKLKPEATLPRRQTKDSVGYDLCSAEAQTLGPGERLAIKTGIAVTVPAGTYGRVAPRSGLAVKFGINVMAGVIDPDYTGEILTVLINHTDTPFAVAPGDRIAQLICEAVSLPSVVEVSELAATERGAKGFGSTGHASGVEVVPGTAADDGTGVEA